jgi:hypothetical protein
MKIPLYLLLSSVLVISCSPDRQGGSETTDTEIEVGEQEEIDQAAIEDMIIHAMVNNRLQAALAEQMQEENLDPKFKIYKEMILNNYEDYQYNLGVLATTYEIEIPQGLTPQAQEQYDRISNLSPEEFKDEFVDLIIKNNQEDLDRLETILTEDSEVMQRGIVEGMHDTIEKQLERAEELDEE